MLCALSLMVGQGNQHIQIWGQRFQVPCFGFGLNSSAAQAPQGPTTLCWAPAALPAAAPVTEIAVTVLLAQLGGATECMLALSARHGGRLRPQPLYWKAMCCSTCISCICSLTSTAELWMTYSPVLQTKDSQHLLSRRPRILR